MGFKDYAAADIAVFVNVDEMADSHDIDGQQIPAIVDSDVLSGQSEYRDGIYLGEILVFVRSSDLPSRPVKNQHMRLDGELYLVSNCSEEDGLLQITLEANEA
ncbi:conserved hypothetical protein [Desulforamulus reducens MI-1]|uniref:Uncharacterized protein n=1 Tax=Desulforamulus reducens (strain ATCC BAA-1160 / DSM 100696 / MI-1) TaxID=349161 RepID=A4J3T9_DESRM|nr:hypothetical protein [Desulforamulus reducens]ABO49742.1 conserved hypothetical protein [Desulforamulus reducens MI-1]